MQETIGQRLKRAREYRNISLEKAGEITRIRPSLLKALEADDFSSMVSAAQARGFLRNYSDYLGLKFDELLAQMERKPAEIPRDPTSAHPEQIVGPLEKLESTSSVPVSDSDQIATKRELPFWKRTLSFLPSRASQLLEIEVTENNSAQNESLEGLDQPPDVVSESNPSSESEGRATTSNPEPPEEGGSDKTQDSTESNKTTAIVESSQSIFAEVMESGYEKSDTGSEAAQPEAQLDPDLTSVQQEGEQDRIVDELNIDPRRASLGANLIPNIIDRIKAVFRIKISTLPAFAKTANLSSNEQAANASSGLSVRLNGSPEKSAEQYLAEIGEKLIERRALLSLTYEEIERHTHIRIPFLKAMENGAHDQLPSPVQTRGLLANYASFLDLDTDQLLLNYAGALQARHRQKYPELTQAKPITPSKPNLPPIRSFIASDVLFGLGVVAIVIGLAVWGLGRLLNPPSVKESIEATAPSIAEVLAGTAVAENPQAVTLIPAKDTPLPTFEVTEVTGSGVQELSSDGVRVQVSLLAVARTYVRVISDGEVVFNDQVIPGNSYPFEADQQVEVLVGNGAALKVTYAGTDLGLMGNLGEVIDRIYTLNGISTPTITPQPSATATPAITITPLTTNTPTPTP